MSEQSAAAYKYPSDRWGAMAKNPTVELGASGEGWMTAVHETWLANGGSEASFCEAFPEYAPVASPKRQ